jgi:type IV secretory pathway VirB2 component (pilin)
MKMKNKILIFIIFFGLFAAASVFAQFVPLEPLPAIGETQPSTSLSGYLQWLFTFAVSSAGILAVLMIVIGGIQYMTAYGSPAKVEDAKNRIYQALLGLLLAISAWLILYTINPDLVKGVLNIPPITQTLPSSMQYG